jgi:hypothetical protein
MSDRGLQPGDELLCPYCGSWHLVDRRNASDSTAARDFLFVMCRGNFYFVGMVGSVPSWPKRSREEPDRE